MDEGPAIGFPFFRFRGNPMPPVLIHDAIRDKKVRLTLKEDTTVARTIEVLRQRYEHLRDRDLSMSMGGTMLDEGWTIGRLVEEMGLDESTCLELDEHVDLEIPLGAEGDLEMGDLDTMEAVSALEAQLDRLEARADQLPSSVENAADPGPSGSSFSLEDDVSSLGENLTAPGGRVAISLPPAGLDSQDLLEEDELDPLPEPASAPRPTSRAAGPESSTRIQPMPIERRVTIRYHSRMVVGRSFPLVVVLSRKEGAGESSAVPPISIVPVVPGSLVSPPERTIDPGPARVEAAFWVTPLSGEGLAEAAVEIRGRSQALEIVPIPARAGRPGTARLLATGGVALLVGSLLTALWSGRLAEFAGTAGRDVPLVAGIGGVLVAAAAIVRLARRPREAGPRTANVKLGGD